MKRVGKPVFFVVVAMLALLTYAAFFGVSSKYGDIDRTYIKGAQDIRRGIDIRGGVEDVYKRQGYCIQNQIEYLCRLPADSFQCV